MRQLGLAVRVYADEHSDEFPRSQHSAFTFGQASWGRAIAEELAQKLGGAVCASRPVVDQGWLPPTRQVGKSGMTVKPKVYLALGISGSFQHMGGLKGNPFIVAVNKNPKAPIFQVASVGVVADVLEFIPELTKKVVESK